MVERGETGHEVEGPGDERERFRVALLEHHVGDPRLRQPLGTQLQEPDREVDSDDRPHLRRDHLGDVPGAARDVEHEHLGVERFQALRRAAGRAAHER